MGSRHHQPQPSPSPPQPSPPPPQPSPSPPHRAVVACLDLGLNVQVPAQAKVSDLRYGAAQSAGGQQAVSGGVRGGAAQSAGGQQAVSGGAACSERRGSTVRGAAEGQQGQPCRMYNGAVQQGSTVRQYNDVRGHTVAGADADPLRCSAEEGEQESPPSYSLHTPLSPDSPPPPPLS